MYMNKYESVWQKLDMNYVGERGNDGDFYPILPRDRARLEVELLEAIQNTHDEGDEGRLPDIYFTERLEATHFFIYVMVPDEEWAVEDPETTWWDFGTVLAKQIDGEWYIWSEDPSDIGNIWYQSTYLKDEAYRTRDLHILRAQQGTMLDGEEYSGQDVYAETVIMLGWKF